MNKNTYLCGFKFRIDTKHPVSTCRQNIWWEHLDFYLLHFSPTMLRKSLFILFCSMPALICKAQDPTFSQFYASRSYMNPAFTGVQKGLSLVAAYRNHYLSIPGAYQTTLVAAEVQEPVINGGFGMVVYRDVAGEAGLTTNAGRINFAYRIPLSDGLGGRAASDLSIGLYGGFIQRSIDWSKLTFLDQIDPVYGFTMPTASVPITQPVAFFDAGGGVAWRTSFKAPRSSEDAYATIGAALAHITNQDESLLGFATRRPLRLTFHGNVELPIKWIDGAKQRSVHWSPNIKMEWQQGQWLSTFGAFAHYEGVYMGFFYQNKYPLPEGINTNALIFNFGWKVKMENHDAFVIGLSYDANTTGLGTASGGSAELTVRYTINNVQLIHAPDGKMKAGKAVKCPDNY